MSSMLILCIGDRLKHLDMRSRALAEICRLNCIRPSAAECVSGNGDLPVRIMQRRMPSAHMSEGPAR